MGGVILTPVHVMYHFPGETLLVGGDLIIGGRADGSAGLGSCGAGEVDPAGDRVAAGYETTAGFTGA